MPDPALHSPRGWIGFGLGSNVGNSRRRLRQALDALASCYGDLRIAPLYATEPISAIEQNDFLNTVALARQPISESSSEHQIRRAVGLAKELEHRAGRRPAARDSPRELDVDLLFWGETQLVLAALPQGSKDSASWSGAIEVPHRRMTERRFVLAPLADLAPGLHLHGRPIELLLRQVSDQRAQRLDWV